MKLLTWNDNGEAYALTLADDADALQALRNNEVTNGTLIDLPADLGYGGANEFCNAEDVLLPEDEELCCAERCYLPATTVVAPDPDEDPGVYFCCDGHVDETASPFSHRTEIMPIAEWSVNN